MLAQIKTRAAAEGISDTVVNSLIQNAAFIPKIVNRDRNQAEFTMVLSDYLNNTVSAQRIADGRKMEQKYPTLLRNVQKTYNIPPSVILAFWGLESHYGNYKAQYQLSDSFLTLIYEGRRETFFTNQLIALMKIADKNNQPLESVRGSWAGAMGHFQFIPTTLEQYGVDGNNDGKIDIINNITDAMFSAGNYLNKLGFAANEKIIQTVWLPQNFDLSLCDAKTKKTLDEWYAMGISGVPVGDGLVGIVCDANVAPAPEFATAAYLTYPNFYRIKKWNSSNAYSVAIGLLSEELR